MEKANGQVVKEVNPTPTPPPTPSPVPSSNGEQQQQQPQQQQPSGDNLKENFKLFAKFGDTRALGETITLSNSDKWFKQAKIIDGKKVTTVDTGIYFKKVAKTKKSLTLAQYNEFLETLAKMKKLEIDELKDKLKTSGPPSTNKTTVSYLFWSLTIIKLFSLFELQTAVVGGAIGRLTDHTKYTGTHKERFDATGKGKGKAGREDVVVNSGYVTGFKAWRIDHTCITHTNVNYLSIC